MTLGSKIKPGESTGADGPQLNFSYLYDTSRRVSSSNIVTGSIDTRHLNVKPVAYRAIGHGYWTGTLTYSGTSGGGDQIPMSDVSFTGFNGGGIYVIGSIKAESSSATDYGEVGIRFKTGTSSYFPSYTDIRASLRTSEHIDIPFHLAQYHDLTGAYPWVTDTHNFNIEFQERPGSVTDEFGCRKVTFTEISVHVFSIGV